MRQFNDSKGMSWSVELSIAAIGRVQDETEVNLCDLTTGNPAAGVRITSEPRLFARVLFAIVEPQAKERSVDEAEFNHRLTGDVLAASFDAVCDELMSFLRACGRGEQADALDKQRRALVAASTLARKRLDAIDVEQLVKEKFEQTLSDVFGGEGKPVGQSPA